MKIDLCNLFGVQEDDEFKIVAKDRWFCNLKYKIKNNILYSSNLKIDAFMSSTLGFNDFKLIEKVIILPKKKKFSQDTLNFFKCIKKKYEWIAKDKGEGVRVFQNKPIKNGWFWEIENQFGGTMSLSAINQNLFNQILWEDEEPIRIDDYVER